FTAHETDIPGLLFFETNFVGDERGYFQEKYQKAKLVKAGIPADFDVVQTNLSYNKQKGVTRGLHAEPWDKFISLVKGKVFVAYVDMRDGPSFGKTATFELTPTTAVYLPQGVANSYQTLEDEVYYLYSVNDHWSAENYEKYCFVNMGDPVLDISWPIPLDQAIINDRDQNHPLLKDAKRMSI
ncbi:MAG TPA: dTDP-4-dehydrorhamnose 3,5-epimerase family protein, partial [Candidatus Saccharimonadales bacterium]|nr:dTDP-4-dehydrorhamnose 3,5-epimerase family protein [Candidatus Saccharimonadales bacterium]